MTAFILYHIVALISGVLVAICLRGERMKKNIGFYIGLFIGIIVGNLIFKFLL